MITKKLYRSHKNKVFAGVFGGLGEYFEVDPVILRLLWVVICIFTAFFPGLITYLIAIVVIPKKAD